ncbi:NAD(P)-dependent oxidoreductase [Candidatus Parabeggiatoa sp. HSG14]|uniref:NAD-dependent epimerase/dehydratase family protein n=1 Tax=Candidatus Parabeggiatoa sp. HSG14 TaxID=3055593 RepID=UPI0025A772B7|nr:NAD(P)-dependent oxidoreductase [Thiotrichales bacterium HSG14]
MAKTILVTGATGFIGQHVIKRLKKEKFKVEGISRHGGIIEDLPIDAVDLANDTQFEDWRQDKKFAAIIHLAADIPKQLTGLVAEKSFKTNISSMLNILKLAHHSNSHIVYASGTSAYGVKGKEDNPLLTEEHKPYPDELYYTSKYVGEILCEQERRSRGLSYTSLRIAAPYGQACKHNTVINIFLKAALESKNLTLYGSGKRTQDFIYVDDVVEAICLALSKHTYGVFNIASGIPVSMKTLAESVLEVVPNSSSQIVYSGKPDPQENYRAIFSIEKARQQLGWLPKIGLLQGLQLTMEFLQEKYSC